MRPRRRRRVVVLTTFAVGERGHGGQLRAFHLYGGLARRVDVEVVGLTPGGEASSSRLGEGFGETIVPMSSSHREAADELGLEVVEVARRVSILELKGEVVGYVFCQTVLRENSEVYVDRRSLYVDDLCVDEHARHMGVATALMNAAVSYAKETGCAGLDLNVWEFNEQALKFYLAYGMKTQRRHMEIVF